MKLRGREREEPTLNLLPLVDVVLLLLIFFMMTSTFVQQGRLRIHLPQASAAPQVTPAGNGIVVTVTAAGHYGVNDRALINNSTAALRAALQAAAAHVGRNTPVMLQADARATHQSVVTAMDVLGSLGFSRIDIATVRDARGRSR